VIVHTDPHEDAYRMIEVVPRTGTLHPRQLAGVTIVVDDLFREED
jgi:hypothetical protein